MISAVIVEFDTSVICCVYALEMKTLLLTQLFQAQFTDTAFVVDRYGYWEFAQFLLDWKFRMTSYIYATNLVNVQ